MGMTNMKNQNYNNQNIFHILFKNKEIEKLKKQNENQNENYKKNIKDFFANYRKNLRRTHTYLYYLHAVPLKYKVLTRLQYLRKYYMDTYIYFTSKLDKKDKCYTKKCEMLYFALKKRYEESETNLKNEFNEALTRYSRNLVIFFELYYELAVTQYRFNKTKDAKSSSDLFFSKAASLQSENASNTNSDEKKKTKPIETTQKDPNSPHEYPAVGIDLGTTYSVAGVVQNNKVIVIPNLSGIRTTPSYVGLQKEKILIGDGAKSLSVYYPGAVAYDCKRMLGKVFSHDDIQRDLSRWPFTVVKYSDKDYRIKLIFDDSSKEFRPIEVSSLILAEIKKFSEKFTMRDCSQVVITVPAYFNDDQRTSTRDAGTIAGMKVLRILNEPTSAAMAYGFEKHDKSKKIKKLCIFDLGGGTYDVSCLEIMNGVFEVKATHGDTHLGGEDFDIAATMHYVEQWNQEHPGTDLTKFDRPFRRIKASFERAKRTLSSGTLAVIDIENIIGEFDFQFSVTRARYENATKDVFAKIEKPLTLCISLAHFTKAEITDIILVGGSKRMPKVQKFVTNYFNGREINKSVNPDEAVALGAAVQGSILTGFQLRPGKEILLLDIIPLSIGVECEGGVFERTLKRNETIPTNGVQIFQASRDYQTEANIKIYEGDRYLCRDNHYLGEFAIKLKPKIASRIQVEVELFVDSNGLLTVSATDKGGYDERTSLKIKAERRVLDSGEVEKMTKEAEAKRKQDEETQKIVTAKTKCKRICLTVIRYCDSFTSEECQKDKQKQNDVSNMRSEGLALEAWCNSSPDTNIPVDDIEKRYDDIEKKFNNFKKKYIPVKNIETLT